MVVRAQSTDAEAALDFVMDAIAGDRFKDSLGQTAESYVRYSLGTAGFVYHVEGWRDVAAERDRYRAALDALWTIVLNDVPCSAGRPCKVCAPVYAKVREALNG